MAQAQATNSTSALDAPVFAGVDDVLLQEGMEGRTLHFSFDEMPGDVVSFISEPGAGNGAQAIQCGGNGNSSVRECRINAAAAYNGATLRMRVQRGGLNYDSPVALVTVSPVAIPASFEKTLQDTSTPAGQPAFFSAKAVATGSVTYTWYVDGKVVQSGSERTLSLPTLASDAGKVLSVRVHASYWIGILSPGLIPGSKQIRYLPRTTVGDAVTLTVTPAAAFVDASLGAQLPAPGGAELNVPAGALAANTSLTITQAAVPANALPPEYKALTPVYRLNTRGVAMRSPAELRVALPEVPPGHSIAWVDIDSLARTQLSKAAASRQGSGVAPLACANLQNTTASGLQRLRLTGTGSMVVTQVRTSACSSTEPRITSATIPSATQAACGKDDDFVLVNGLDGDEQSLVSRHVDCRSGIAASERFDVDLQQQDNTSTFTLVGSPSSPTPNGYTRSTWAYVDSAMVETQVSVYGPSNALEKTISLRSRLRDVAYNNQYPPSAPRPSTVRMRPVLACTDAEVCEKLVNAELSVPLSGAWSNTVVYRARFKMPAGSQQMSVRMMLNRFEYALSGNDFGLAGAPDVTRPFDPNVGSLPELTCDVNLARSLTKGCVFTAAAAVFSLDENNPQSAGHIREALRVASMPGRYVAKQNTRAIAGAANPLNRTRVLALINSNRSISHAACRAEFTNAPPTCPVITDPDKGVEDGPCDCDEYPPASTLQGGGDFYKRNPTTSKPLSIQRIASSDNRSAGARLGAFYTKNRIKDGDTFFVEQR